ncbi:hypothetical protein SKAU_G00364530 [Synaphobranchus kaupii]|uniref:Uncharacterized protein n=1 Tax=Synaphobranchus kaupii TaxID=118154 RepID=A0A9Q1IF66_SYNKA|nr:hypothetical protein SKAU_G00364530 [Synaphobranchus kaupii]
MTDQTGKRSLARYPAKRTGRWTLRTKPCRAPRITGSIPASYDQVTATSPLDYFPRTAGQGQMGEIGVLFLTFAGDQSLLFPAVAAASFSG